jgi:hypothetical protein
MSPMTAANPGTVWILGAGFSRSLGAPLFRDLFRSDLQILASIGYLPVEMKAALDTYRSYAPSDMGGHAELGTLWNDPEDFLYKLESATAGSPYHRSLFPRLAVPDIKIMAHMTTAALAIECSHFLVGDDLKAERWMPYRRWASQLNENDTVLTFNYDRVPELLSGNSASPEGPPMLEVAVPSVRRASNDRLGAEVRARGAAPVFKMHGSVDWWKRNGLISSDPLRTFHDQPDSPVLGIPGPGKLDLRSNRSLRSGVPRRAPSARRGASSSWAIDFLRRTRRRVSSCYKAFATDRANWWLKLFSAPMSIIPTLPE